ncbi:MAG: 30S ribosomal protein S9 [Candidatus Thermoplasmatota archaeon]|nr:30S ribosomal protein S9 [Candidatus Thermoplasmatota archaeon]MDD5778739.1 30S ribosomal protein S9 [Candidatus Thermoplasmatota archaeon]
MVKAVVVSGKRKRSIARAVARKGTGTVRINSIDLNVYRSDFIRNMISEPLQMADKHADKLDISVNVEGGGPMSQAQAIRTAVAKAIVSYTEDEDLRQMFMDYDRTLLVNDTRRSEPKKQLGRGARKKRQKSYR